MRFTGSNMRRTGILLSAAGILILVASVVYLCIYPGVFGKMLLLGTMTLVIICGAGMLLYGVTILLATHTAEEVREENAMIGK